MRAIIRRVTFAVAGIAIAIFAILTGTFGVDIHWQ